MRAFRPGRLCPIHIESEEEELARQENMERYIVLAQEGQPLFDRPSRARRLEDKVRHKLVD